VPEAAEGHNVFVHVEFVQPKGVMAVTVSDVRSGYPSQAFWTSGGTETGETAMPHGTIQYADINAAEFDARISCLAHARPHVPQDYGRPLGVGGFGLASPDIRDLTTKIMVRVLAKVRVRGASVALPNSYPSGEIQGGDLGVYDPDVVARLVVAIKAAGYEVAGGGA
jgi:hypothetical protein